MASDDYQMRQFWKLNPHSSRHEGNTKISALPLSDVPKDIAIKHDNGKRDWSLLPYDSVEEVVKVLEFGANKYARDNWKRGEGFKYTRSFNALQRHILAFMRGEDNDPETGISHLSHAMCNLLFMQHFVLNKDKYKNCDDRSN